MKKTKFIVTLVTGAMLAIAFSGCSIIDPTSTVTSESSASSAAGVDKSDKAGQTVDESIEAPAFAADLTGSACVAAGSEYTIDGTATSSDGGDIEYQWYISNTSSNGGGTEIDGADEAAYTVDTSEVGYEYYYVVASNVHSDSYNMATSGIREVEVIASGDWASDETGTKYVAADGTYPANKWVIIGTDTYLFDENGYRRAGWYYDGTNYLYFDEEGRYQEGTVVPEGTTVDENGNVVLPQTDQAAADQAAADAAAAQAAADAAAAQAAADQAAADAAAAQ